MKKVQEKLAKKRLRKLFLTSFFFLYSILLSAQGDTLAEYMIFNYIIKRDFNNCNLIIKKISGPEKLLLVRNIFLSDSKEIKNNRCNNIIVNRQNVKIYDPVLETEMKNLSNNWRLKREVLYMLIYDILVDSISDFSDRAFYKNDDYYHIIYTGKERNVSLNKRRKIFCKEMVPDDERHAKIIKNINRHFEKILKYGNSFEKAMKIPLPAEVIVKKINTN